VIKLDSFIRRLCKNSRAEADRKNRAETEARRDRERHEETGKGGLSTVCPADLVDVELVS
jgi:hypothetical protein